MKYLPSVTRTDADDDEHEMPLPTPGEIALEPRAPRETLRVGE